MSIRARVQGQLLDINRPGNFVRDAWNRLSRLPGGKRLFSELIGQAAPYTGSMRARVVELQRGYARVQLADRRRVRNHLHSIHAVALANLAELTGNVAMAYSVPDDARFIVAGLSIDYLKKARGMITGESFCPLPRGNEKVTYEVPVTLRDRDGDAVAQALLRTLVGPKNRRGEG